MKKVYVISAVLFVVGLAVLISQYGLSPRKIPIMKPSYFDRSEEIGAVFARRFLFDIKTTPIVVVGVPPGRPKHFGFVEGFAQVFATESGQKFSKVIVDSHLPREGFGENAESVDLLKEWEQVKKDLTARGRAGEKTIIVAPVGFVSKSFADSLAGQLEQEVGQKVISVSTSTFALDPTQEGEIEVRCQVGAQQAIGYGSFGCLALKKSRMLYRKKILRSKPMIAVADQLGRDDYLIYISPPVRAVENTIKDTNL